MTDLASPKHDIRFAFDRAAPDYDRHAEFQRLICNRLIEQLGEAHAPPLSGVVLDAGSGTGYGAACLQARWPGVDVLCADFAPAMLAAMHSAERARVAADIEALPLRGECLSLWFSNLALQWCETRDAFAEAFRALRPGGLLAASTLGPATLHELRSAFAGADGYRHVNDFVATDQLVAQLQALGFAQPRVEREAITLFRPDVRAVLLELRAIGASHVAGGRRRGAMSRQAWMRLQDRYETLRSARGLPVTYDAVYLFAHKPGTP